MEHSPLWSMTLPKDLSLKEYIKKSDGDLPRQKLPTYYRINGALYIRRIDYYPDGSIELPCNADIIEAVTYGFEDWNYTDNIKPNGDVNSAFTEGYIESRKAFNNPLYISGQHLL